MYGLRRSIFLFFVGLLSLALCVNFVLVYRSTWSHTRAQVERQLHAGWQVFGNELNARRQAQTAMAGLITQDFGLRSEIATFSDRANVESLRVVLDNFRQRSSADLALATDASGRVLAATDARFASGSLFRLPGGPNAGQQDMLQVRDDRLYHIFVTPIYAPAPNLIGWFVLGFAQSDETTRHLSDLTGLQVSFVQRQGRQMRVLASSLDRADRDSLQMLDWPRPRVARALRADDQLLYAAPLQGPDGDLDVVLQRSLSEAMQGYRPLFWQLTLMAGVTLGLTVLGAFFIAGSVSRPLSELARYVRRLGSGDYAAAPPPPSRGEVQELFAEFDTMRQAIAERESQIAYAAYHDPLTGLPNRLRFQQWLQDGIAAQPQQAAAVVVLGLNHFKDINDTLGHHSGDRVLQQIAQRLLARQRPQDRVARFSGDAFVILLSGVERHEVLALGLHYKQVLDQPVVIENIAMTVNAAMGIGLYPEHAENPATLLQRAEIAMYVAKEKRLPCALYSHQQNRYSLLRLSLMSELCGAIERGELVLHYQPKLDLRLQRITGVECLVRWQHPVHGLIFPDDFIPLAEQTGNIRYLTLWAIRTALAQCARWRQQGMELMMAVNISSVDLQDPALIGNVADALAASGLTADSLWLEVTESAVMHDIDKAVELLGGLRQRGVRLAIDDYGTGYSSMAQLKRLPVQEMKIDKSFVMDLTHNEDDAIIVRSTIELGHNMGLSLVAEGVESEEIMQLLSRYGCDIAQGYWIARPMAAEAFEHWWRQRMNERPDKAERA